MKKLILQRGVSREAKLKEQGSINATKRAILEMIAPPQEEEEIR